RPEVVAFHRKAEGLLDLRADLDKVRALETRLGNRPIGHLHDRDEALREAIVTENFSRLVVRRDNAAEEGGARIVERTGNRYAGIAGGIHSDPDDPKRLERGAEGASTREDDRVRDVGAALQSARDRNLRRDRDLDAYLLSTASKDSLGTQSDKSRVESVRHVDADSEAFGPSLRSRRGSQREREGRTPAGRNRVHDCGRTKTGCWGPHRNACFAERCTASTDAACRGHSTTAYRHSWRRLTG